MFYFATDIEERSKLLYIFQFITLNLKSFIVRFIIFSKHMPIHLFQGYNQLMRYERKSYKLTRVIPL